MTTRRRFISTAASTAAVLHLTRYSFANSPSDAATCPLIAEQEVGPFYVAKELLRSNITEDRPGVPLSLRIQILDARTCTPLRGAAIDIWHCDASGLYSGYTKANFGPPPEGGPGGGGPMGDGPGGPPPGGPGEHGGPPPQMHQTDKLTFLRGIQFTGNDGNVSFQTIFPGFYQGRVNHIHFKVRVGGHALGKTYDGGHTAHTGQVFFPEDVTLRLMALEPYASHHIHRTTPAEDGIMQQQHGDTSIARLQELQPANTYRADIVISVDPTATPAPSIKVVPAAGQDAPAKPSAQPRQASSSVQSHPRRSDAKNTFVPPTG